MIRFTDDSLYAKGTCNMIVSDPQTGNIFYQSDKFSTGSITPSTNLNEIRAGLGNPIVAMIPSDAGIAVDFDSAAFSLKMKAAQLGATFTYSSPAPVCQIIEATGTSLAVSVATNAPVAPLGLNEPICYVQEAGAPSLVGVDGTAYKIDPATGAITGFTATTGKSYRVWYYAIKASAQLATIGALIDPKVVRAEAQIAVFSNRAGGTNQGTRVGWLYWIIPYLKLQADAALNGDQGTADTTKVSGQAIAYDPDVVPADCADGGYATLGYYLYVPDNDAESIVGLAVVGGVTQVQKSTTAQLPVRFVMVDGSLAVPGNYSSGFTYQLTSPPSGTSISAAGLITAGASTGSCACTTQYTAGDKTYTVQSTVQVVN